MRAVYEVPKPLPNSLTPKMSAARLDNPQHLMQCENHSNLISVQVRTRAVAALPGLMLSFIQVNYFYMGRVFPDAPRLAPDEVLPPLPATPTPRYQDINGLSR
jgi:hypothetical protein